MNSTSTSLDLEMVYNNDIECLTIKRSSKDLHIGVPKVLKLVRSTAETYGNLEEFNLLNKLNDKIYPETIIKIEYNGKFYLKSLIDLNIYDLVRTNVLVGKWNDAEEKIYFVEDLVKKIEDLVKRNEFLEELVKLYKEY
jgi:hypothetical protein